MSQKPKSALDSAQEQFDKFDQNIKDLTMDRMNQKKGEAPEHKIAQADIAKAPEVYLKPKRMIGSKEKFNENFREQYNKSKEYVHYTVQHEEIKGEVVEFWIKPFPGVPAEEWAIPSGRAVWIPRYVAEHLENNCTYHRLKTQDRPTSIEGGMTYFGSMVVDDLIYRISARPVSTRKLIYLHAN